MYETYSPITSGVVTFTDTSIARNSLGYLILDNQQRVSIPVISTLYDYSKYKEILNVGFTEIFPNDTTTLTVASLQSEILSLQSQLTGSQIQITNLNTIINGLEAPSAETEMWRTRKTFLRIVGAHNNDLYPTGFPIINNWTQAQWDNFGGGISFALGPTVSADEQALLDQFQLAVQELQTSINSNPSDPTLLAQAVVINNASIPGYLITLPGGQSYNGQSTANTNVIIARLQSTTDITMVTNAEIDLLQPSDIPNIYKQLVSGTSAFDVITYSYLKPDGTPLFADIIQFRTLCKKYAKRARNIGAGNIGVSVVMPNDSTGVAIAEERIAWLYDYSSNQPSVGGQPWYAV